MLTAMHDAHFNAGLICSGLYTLHNPQHLPEGQERASWAED